LKLFDDALLGINVTVTGVCYSSAVARSAVARYLEEIGPDVIQGTFHAITPYLFASGQKRSSINPLNRKEILSYALREGKREATGGVSLITTRHKKG
jgi:hypothetical protein